MVGQRSGVIKPSHFMVGVLWTGIGFFALIGGAGLSIFAIGVILNAFGGNGGRLSVGLPFLGVGLASSVVAWIIWRVRGRPHGDTLEITPDSLTLTSDSALPRSVPRADIALVTVIQRGGDAGFDPGYIRVWVYGPDRRRLADFHPQWVGRSPLRVYRILTRCGYPAATRLAGSFDLLTWKRTNAAAPKWAGEALRD